MAVDFIGLHRRALESFGGRLRRVRSADLGLPTPCPDWDVRALIAHVVSADEWVRQLLGGCSHAEIQVAEDVLGGDPYAAWHASASSLHAAFAHPNSLERIVDHPVGRISAGRLIFFRCLDTVVHAWDLARAIGADESLDAVAVSSCREVVAPVALMFAAAGLYGPVVAVGPDADPQTELLGLLGRRVC